MKNFWIILSLFGISFNCWAHLLPSNYIITLHHDHGRIIQIESNFWSQEIRYGIRKKTKSIWSDFYWEKSKSIPSYLYFTVNNLPCKISKDIIVDLENNKPLSKCWDGEYAFSSFVSSSISTQLNLKCNGETMKKDIRDVIEGTFNEEERSKIYHLR